MKYFSILMLLAALCVPLPSAIGQIEKEDDEATEFRNVPLCDARIEFDHTVFDFGSIVKGSSVAHSYWFSNSGTDTLIITKIKPTCGCISTKTGGIVVPPGERGNIDIIFNSGKFNGKVTKAIKIECNDSVSPYMDIRFKSTINNPLLNLEYTPLQVDYRNVKIGESKSFMINITNTDSTASKLVIVDKPSEDFIKTKLAKELLHPGDETQLKLTLLKNIDPGKEEYFINGQGSISI